MWSVPSLTPQALVLLQLRANLDVLLVASWQELSQYVCAFTKALSQLPSKYGPLWGLSGDRAAAGGRGPHRWCSPSSVWCPHFRQFRDSQAFSFCTAGHWASGQQVTRDGSGLRGVWWRQIRQFNRVSPAVADAVVTAFPSPRLLQQVSPPKSLLPGPGLKVHLLTPVPALGSAGLQHRAGTPEPPS